MIYSAEFCAIIRGYMAMAVQQYQPSSKVSGETHAFLREAIIDRATSEID